MSQSVARASVSFGICQSRHKISIQVDSLVKGN